jgi:glycosyltransferase involved in cell wall biosynthesis
VAQKGFDLTLAVIETALQRLAPIRFRLLLHSAEPTASREEWLKDVRRLSRDYRVSVEYDVRRSGVCEALEWSDVLLHPAHTETQGLVILEALAAGRPVVCRPLPVLREQFGALRHLRYVPSDEADAFLQELLRVHQEGVIETDTLGARSSVAKFTSASFQRYVDLLF